MLIGYARVSALHQSLDRQLIALEGAGVSKVYQEKLSGKSLKNRPQLEKCLSSLQAGDVLVVAEWDRATRSLYDGIDIMRRVHAVGALVKILDKPHFDLTTPMGRGFLSMLSALAEDERERINARTSAGRKVALAKGVRFGRKPKLTPLQEERVLELRKLGKSAREIAPMFGVHHATIARVVAA